MAGRPVGAKTIPYRSSLVREPDGTYLASVRVPAELLADIGAQYLRFSLNTKDLDEANFLLPYTARQIAGGLKKVAAEKRRAEMFEQDTDHLRLDSEEPYVAVRAREQMLADIRDACTPAHAIRREPTYPLDDLETRKLLAVVDCFILDFQIPLKRYTRTYWHLVSRIDRLRRSKLAEEMRQTFVSEAQASDQFNGRREASIIDTVTLFEVDHGANWSPGTRQRYYQAIEFLIGMFGADTPVRSLTRDDLRRLRNILEDLASNWRHRMDLRYLSLEDAAKRSRELKLPLRGSKSIRETFDNIRVIMEFAVAEGLIDRNFAVRMDRGLPRHSSDPPYPFTVSELNAVFHHPPLYDPPPPIEQRDDLFWLPLIGLFTGMRLSETAQLWTHDIAIVEHIPIIRIQPQPPGDDPKEDKRLKTLHSTRVMPIHPELQRIGFVRFWEAARAQGKIRLFPQCAREGPSHSFRKTSKSLTTFVRLAVPDNERVTYRSFRHTFRDAARDADLPRDRARVLGGWGKKDTSEQYGVGGAVPRLYRDIQKIHYPGLDLSHLYLDGGIAD